jgi:hypothetical protein
MVRLALRRILLTMVGAFVICAGVAIRQRGYIGFGVKHGIIIFVKPLL